MFSTCRKTDTSELMTDPAKTILAFCVLALFALTTACSKQSAAPVDEPWITEGETVRGEATAGGIATSYAAYFKDAQLNKIVETRKTEGNPKAEYVFTGARLTRFNGAAIARDAQLEIEFDMKGAVTLATNATPDDIAAVRNRAQLLRSLALSRRSTLAHTESDATHDKSANP
jgi:hypothetical protein